jgi:hypothetical protein
LNLPPPTLGSFSLALSKLALARLEVPERAKARKAIPTSHEIWIAAGRLLEQAAMDQKSARYSRGELCFVWICTIKVCRSESSEGGVSFLFHHYSTY